MTDKPRYAIINETADRNDIPPTATYRDGEPRPWQSRQRDKDLQSFEWRVLNLKDVARVIGMARTAP